MYFSHLVMQSLCRQKSYLAMFNIQYIYGFRASPTAGAKQPIHWFLGGKGLGIQQGRSGLVGSPKSSPTLWPVYTMDHEVKPCKRAFFNGPNSRSTSMVRLLKKLVLRALGPSLSVNRMWTKKNVHDQKVNVLISFLYMPKKGNFEKNKFDHSLAFTSC